VAIGHEFVAPVVDCRFVELEVWRFFPYGCIDIFGVIEALLAQCSTKGLLGHSQAVPIRFIYQQLGRGHMPLLETTIDADTEALHAIAEHYTHIDVVYKAYGDSLPYRWEVQLTEPRQHLGKIQLTPAEISLPYTERRIILRREFLRILKETGHDH
jgi:hypothetical protein